MCFKLIFKEVCFEDKWKANLFFKYYVNDGSRSKTTLKSRLNFEKHKCNYTQYNGSSTGLEYNGSLQYIKTFHGTTLNPFSYGFKVVPQ